MRAGPGQMPVFGAEVRSTTPSSTTSSPTSSTSTTLRTPAGSRSGAPAPSPRASWRGCVGIGVAPRDRRAWIGTRSPPATRSRPVNGRDRGAERAACFVVSDGRRRSGSPSCTGSGGQPQLEGVAARGHARRHRHRHRAVGQGIHARRRGQSRSEGRWRRREDEVEAFAADFEAGRGSPRAGGALLVAPARRAVAAFGAALLFPIRSLGPRPGKRPEASRPTRPASRVVDEDGAPRQADRRSPSTAWSRCGPRATPTPPTRRRCSSACATTCEFEPRAGREDWTVDGVVAYSKLCTHVGCPVGLYQAEEALLLCPCHQSTFDVLDGARPGVRPRRAVAAAAAARRRRRRLPRRHR